MLNQTRKDVMRTIEEIHRDLRHQGDVRAQYLVVTNMMKELESASFVLTDELLREKVARMNVGRKKSNAK